MALSVCALIKTRQIRPLRFNRFQVKLWIWGLKPGPWCLHRTFTRKRLSPWSSGLVDFIETGVHDATVHRDGVLSLVLWRNFT